METSEHKCCADILDSYTYRGRRCNKNAKIEHEGKWYCGTHSPLLKKKRQQEWQAKYDAERAAREANYEKQRKYNERAGLCVSACEGISNPSDFVRAARELGNSVRRFIEEPDYQLAEVEEAFQAFRAAGGGE